MRRVPAFEAFLRDLCFQLAQVGFHHVWLVLTTSPIGVLELEPRQRLSGAKKRPRRRLRGRKQYQINYRHFR